MGKRKEREGRGAAEHSCGEDGRRGWDSGEDEAEQRHWALAWQE